MKLTIKQTQAIDILEDNETTELLFGGGAGGGKSAFGCYWQIKRRLKYPGTRGLIGRAKLKVLKVYKSTEWLHKAINEARKKEFPFLYKPNKETKNETT